MAVLRFVQIVGGHQHGCAFGGQLVNQAPERPTRQRIDAARGFVQKHNGRLVQDGAAKTEPLFPSAGERPCQHALATAEPGHLQYRLAPGRESFAVQSVDPAEERDVLVNRQLLVE